MAAFFDLPVEELMTYEGINPRPDDFDAYWEAALAEMDAVDPEVEIILDDEFQTSYATCSHLWFTGVGGARIHAKLLQPKNSVEPHPAVLMFHGYTANCGSWIDKLGYVADGYTVASLDCRGQGGLSEDVGGVIGTTLNGHIVRGLDDTADQLMFRAQFLDAAQLAKIVMNMDDVDATRVGAMGGSQGGALALACGALEPRIARVSALHPFLCDFQRVYELGLAEDAYGELTEYFRRFDPQHKREKEIFTRLGYIDIQNLAPRIQGDVLMGCGLVDTVCPPSSQFAAYNKILAKKRVEFFPDYAHEPSPGFAEMTYCQMMEMA